MVGTVNESFTWHSMDMAEWIHGRRPYRGITVTKRHLGRRPEAGVDLGRTGRAREHDSTPRTPAAPLSTTSPWICSQVVVNSSKRESNDSTSEEVVR